jgi:hypothetical protein
LPLEYKDVLKSFSWCIHRVFNHSTPTKNEENLGLKIREMSGAIFSKKLYQTIANPLHVFFALLFYF